MSFDPSEIINEVKKNEALLPDLESTLKKIKDELLDTYKNYSGVGNQKQPELKPNYEQTSNEVLIDGKTNCFIVLGADRPAGTESGFGGSGTTGAACIDIVSGFMGTRPISAINTIPVKSSKNFQVDAARVYVSQKSDIDQYLNIPKYSYSAGGAFVKEPTTENKSSVAVISDATRIYGRESVKIITSHIGINSCDVDVEPCGIDLIAGYDVKDEYHIPQPMVKGDNLINCLKRMILLLEKVQVTVTNFAQAQILINEYVMKHRHQDSTGNSTDTMMQNNIQKENFKIIKKVIPDIMANQAEFATTTKEFFNAGHKNYINSIYNRVN